jgi:hypothetical protein
MQYGFVLPESGEGLKTKLFNPLGSEMGLSRGDER